MRYYLSRCVGASFHDGSSSCSEATPGRPHRDELLALATEPGAKPKAERDSQLVTLANAVRRCVAGRGAVRGAGPARKLRKLSAKLVARVEKKDSQYVARIASRTQESNDDV